MPLTPAAVLSPAHPAAQGTDSDSSLTRFPPQRRVTSEMGGQGPVPIATATEDHRDVLHTPGNLMVGNGSHTSCSGECWSLPTPQFEAAAIAPESNRAAAPTEVPSVDEKCTTRTSAGPLCSADDDFPLLDEHQAQPVLTAEEAVRYYCAECARHDLKPNSNVVAQLTKRALEMRLGQNYLGERGVAPLMAVLRYVPIVVMDFRGGNLSEASIVAIVTAMEDHRTLASLDLRGNVISLDAARHLLRLASRNPNLVSIGVDEGTPKALAILQQCIANAGQVVPAAGCIQCHQAVLHSLSGSVESAFLTAVCKELLSLGKALTPVHIEGLFRCILALCEANDGVLFVCDQGECIAKLAGDVRVAVECIASRCAPSVPAAATAPSGRVEGGGARPPRLRILNRCVFTVSERILARRAAATAATATDAAETLGEDGDGDGMSAMHLDRIWNVFTCSVTPPRKPGRGTSADSRQPQPKSLRQCGELVTVEATKAKVWGRCTVCGKAMPLLTRRHGISQQLIELLHGFASRPMWYIRPASLLRLCYMMMLYADVRPCARTCLSNLVLYAAYGVGGAQMGITNACEPQLSGLQVPLEELPLESFSDVVVAHYGTAECSYDEDITCAMTVASMVADIERVPIDPYMLFAAGRHMAQLGPLVVGMELRHALYVVQTIGAITTHESPFWKDGSASGRGIDHQHIPGEVRRPPLRASYVDWTRWPETGNVNMKALLGAAFARRHPGVYVVDGIHGNMFDNVRAALWAFRSQRRAVAVTLRFGMEWLRSGSGVIHDESPPADDGFLTTVKIVGQAVIHATFYLVALSNFGPSMGSGGFFFIPKSIFNSRTVGSSYMIIDYSLLSQYHSLRNGVYETFCYRLVAQSARNLILKRRQAFRLVVTAILLASSPANRGAPAAFQARTALQPEVQRVVWEHLRCETRRCPRELRGLLAPRRSSLTLSSSSSSKNSIPTGGPYEREPGGSLLIAAAARRPLLSRMWEWCMSGGSSTSRQLFWWSEVLGADAIAWMAEIVAALDLQHPGWDRIAPAPPQLAQLIAPRSGRCRGSGFRSATSVSSPLDDGDRLSTTNARWPTDLCVTTSIGQSGALRREPSRSTMGVTQLKWMTALAERAESEAFFATLRDAGVKSPAVTLTLSDPSLELHGKRTTAHSTVEGRTEAASSLHQESSPGIGSIIVLPHQLPGDSVAQSLRSDSSLPTVELIGHGWRSVNLTEADGTVSASIIIFQRNFVCRYDMTEQRLISPMVPISDDPYLLCFPFSAGVDCAFNIPDSPRIAVFVSGEYWLLWDTHAQASEAGPFRLDEHQQFIPLVAALRSYSVTTAEQSPPRRGFGCFASTVCPFSCVVPVPHTSCVVCCIPDPPPSGPLALIYDMQECKVVGSIPSTTADAISSASDPLVGRIGNMFSSLVARAGTRTVMTSILTRSLGVSTPGDTGLVVVDADGHVMSLLGESGIYRTESAAVLPRPPSGLTSSHAVDRRSMAAGADPAKPAVVTVRESFLDGLPLALVQITTAAIPFMSAAVLRRIPPQELCDIELLTPSPVRGSEAENELRMSCTGASELDGEPLVMADAEKSWLLEQFRPVLVRTTLSCSSTSASPLDVLLPFTRTETDVATAPRVSDVVVLSSKRAAPSDCNEPTGRRVMDWIEFDFGEHGWVAFAHVQLVLCSAGAPPNGGACHSPGDSGGATLAQLHRAAATALIECCDDGVSFRPVSATPLPQTCGGAAEWCGVCVVGARWGPQHASRFWRVRFPDGFPDGAGVVKVHWFTGTWVPSMPASNSAERALVGALPKALVGPPGVSAMPLTSTLQTSSSLKSVEPVPQMRCTVFAEAPLVFQPPHQLLEQAYLGSLAPVLATVSGCDGTWFEKHCALPLVNTDREVRGVLGVCRFFCGDQVLDIDLDAGAAVDGGSMRLAAHPSFAALPFPFNRGFDAVFYPYAADRVYNVVALVCGERLLEWDMSTNSAHTGCIAPRVPAVQRLADVDYFAGLPLAAVPPWEPRKPPALWGSNAAAGSAATSQSTRHEAAASLPPLPTGAAHVATVVDDVVNVWCEPDEVFVVFRPVPRVGVDADAGALRNAVRKDEQLVVRWNLRSRRAVHLPCYRSQLPALAHSYAADVIDAPTPLCVTGLPSRPGAYLSFAGTAAELRETMCASGDTRADIPPQVSMVTHSRLVGPLTQHLPWGKPRSGCTIVVDMGCVRALVVGLSTRLSSVGCLAGDAGALPLTASASGPCPEDHWEVSTSDGGLTWHHVAHHTQLVAAQQLATTVWGTHGGGDVDGFTAGDRGRRFWRLRHTPPRRLAENTLPPQVVAAYSQLQLLTLPVRRVSAVPTRFAHSGVVVGALDDLLTQPETRITFLCPLNEDPTEMKADAETDDSGASRDAVPTGVSSTDDGSGRSHDCVNHVIFDYGECAAQWPQVVGFSCTAVPPSLADFQLHSRSSPTGEPRWPSGASKSIAAPLTSWMALYSDDGVVWTVCSTAIEPLREAGAGDDLPAQITLCWSPMARHRYWRLDHAHTHPCDAPSACCGFMIYEQLSLVEYSGPELFIGSVVQQAALPNSSSSMVIGFPSRVLSVPPHALLGSRPQPLGATAISTDPAGFKTSTAAAVELPLTPGSTLVIDLTAAHAEAAIGVDLTLHPSSHAYHVPLAVEFSDDGTTWCSVSSSTPLDEPATATVGNSQTLLVMYGTSATARWKPVGAHRFWRLRVSDPPVGLRALAIQHVRLLPCGPMLYDERPQSPSALRKGVAMSTGQQEAFVGVDAIVPRGSQYAVEKLGLDNTTWTIVAVVSAGAGRSLPEGNAVSLGMPRQRVRVLWPPCGSSQQWRLRRIISMAEASDSPHPSSPTGPDSRSSSTARNSPTDRMAPSPTFASTVAKHARGRHVAGQKGGEMGMSPRGLKGGKAGMMVDARKSTRSPFPAPTAEVLFADVVWLSAVCITTKVVDVAEQPIAEPVALPAEVVGDGEGEAPTTRPAGFIWVGKDSGTLCTPIPCLGTLYETPQRVAPRTPVGHPPMPPKLNAGSAGGGGDRRRSSARLNAGSRGRREELQRVAAAAAASSVGEAEVKQPTARPLTLSWNFGDRRAQFSGVIVEAAFIAHRISGEVKEPGHSFLELVPMCPPAQLGRTDPVGELSLDYISENFPSVDPQLLLSVAGGAESAPSLETTPTTGACGSPEVVTRRSLLTPTGAERMYKGRSSAVRVTVETSNNGVDYVPVGAQEVSVSDALVSAPSTTISPLPMLLRQSVLCRLGGWAVNSVSSGFWRVCFELVPGADCSGVRALSVLVNRVRFLTAYPVAARQDGLHSTGGMPLRAHLPRLSNPLVGVWEEELFCNDARFRQQCVEGLDQAQSVASGLREESDVEARGVVAQQIVKYQADFVRFFTRMQKDATRDPNFLELPNVTPVLNKEIDVIYILYKAAVTFQADALADLVRLIGQPLCAAKGMELIRRSQKRSKHDRGSVTSLSVANDATVAKSQLGLKTGRGTEKSADASVAASQPRPASPPRRSWFYPMTEYTGRLSTPFYGFDSLPVSLSVRWSLSLEFQRDTSLVSRPAVNAMSPHLASVVLAVSIPVSDWNATEHFPHLRALSALGLTGRPVVLAYTVNDVVFPPEYPLRNPTTTADAGATLHTVLPYRILPGVNFLSTAPLSGAPTQVADVLRAMIGSAAVEAGSALFVVTSAACDSEEAVARFSVPVHLEVPAPSLRKMSSRRSTVRLRTPTPNPCSNGNEAGGVAAAVAAATGRTTSASRWLGIDGLTVPWVEMEVLLGSAAADAGSLADNAAPDLTRHVSFVSHQATLRIDSRCALPFAVAGTVVTVRVDDGGVEGAAVSDNPCCVGSAHRPRAESARRAKVSVYESSMPHHRIAPLVPPTTTQGRDSNAGKRPQTERRTILLHGRLANATWRNPFGLGAISAMAGGTVTMQRPSLPPILCVRDVYLSDLSFTSEVDVATSPSRDGNTVLSMEGILNIPPYREGYRCRFEWRGADTVPLAQRCSTARDAVESDKGRFTSPPSLGVSAPATSGSEGSVNTISITNPSGTFFALSQPALAREHWCRKLAVDAAEFNFTLDLHAVGLSDFMDLANLLTGSAGANQGIHRLSEEASVCHTRTTEWVKQLPLAISATIVVHPTQQQTCGTGTCELYGQPGQVEILICQNGLSITGAVAAPLRVGGMWLAGQWLRVHRVARDPVNPQPQTSVMFTMSCPRTTVGFELDRFVLSIGGSYWTSATPTGSLRRECGGVPFDWSLAPTAHRGNALLHRCWDAEPSLQSVYLPVQVELSPTAGLSAVLSTPLCTVVMDQQGGGLSPLPSHALVRHPACLCRAVSRCLNEHAMLAAIVSRGAVFACEVESLSVDVVSHCESGGAALSGPLHSLLWRSRGILFGARFDVVVATDLVSLLAPRTSVNQPESPGRPWHCCANGEHSAAMGTLSELLASAIMEQCKDTLWVLYNTFVGCRRDTEEAAPNPSSGDIESPTTATPPSCA